MKPSLRLRQNMDNVFRKTVILRIKHQGENWRVGDLEGNLQPACLLKRFELIAKSNILSKTGKSGRHRDHHPQLGMQGKPFQPISRRVIRLRDVNQERACSIDDFFLAGRYAARSWSLWHGAPGQDQRRYDERFDEGA